VRAERTLRTGPSGSWESTLALTWDPRQPQVVEIAVLAEPPHPALPSGRWLLRREILATGVSQPVAADGVRIAPLPEDDHVRLELDAVASCALPISWVDAFLRRTTDRAPDLTVTPPVA
jgi:hypothetical protein